MAHKFFKNDTGKLQFCGLWHCADWYEGTNISEVFAFSNCMLIQEGQIVWKHGVL